MQDVLTYIFTNRILSKLTLSKPVDKAILRTTGRLIELKGSPHLALETFYTDGKTSQKNIPIEEATDTLTSLIPDDYKQLNLITPNGTCEVKASRKGKLSIIDRVKRDQTEAVSLDHNRRKNYIISPDKAVDFLVALGVQDKNGRIFDKKRSKFRQINRFLEMVADVEDRIVTGDSLYILDLCCGKSYLSFAVYYYFTQIKGLTVTMDCVDLKRDVIDFCSRVADSLGYDGLHFHAGDIRTFAIRRTPDLTVSLHACDIATDIVLAKAIDSASRVILSTPCCHHEMMHQLKPQSHPLDFLLEHSILKQKFADAATDALRCKILEMNGYDVTALELIDPEETPKNVLIRATRRTRTAPERINRLRQEYDAICTLLGISPYLRSHLPK